MDYQEEKVELSEEDVLEINRLLQEAADEDMVGVVEDLAFYDLHDGLDPNMEGWDKYVKRVLEEGPPEEEEV